MVLCYPVTLPQYAEAKKIVYQMLRYGMPCSELLDRGFDSNLVLPIVDEMNPLVPPRHDNVTRTSVAQDHVPYAQPQSSAVLGAPSNHSAYPTFPYPSPNVDGRQQYQQRQASEFHLQQQQHQFQRQQIEQLKIQQQQQPPKQLQQWRQPPQPRVISTQLSHNGPYQAPAQGRPRHAPPLGYDPLNPSALLTKEPFASSSAAPSNSRGQSIRLHNPAFVPSTQQTSGYAMPISSAQLPAQSTSANLYYSTTSPSQSTPVAKTNFSTQTTPVNSSSKHQSAVAASATHHASRST